MSPPYKNSIYTPVSDAGNPVENPPCLESTIVVVGVCIASANLWWMDNVRLTSTLDRAVGGK